MRETQARFFDSNPPLYPWPHLLREHGLRRLFKPREAFWGRAWQRISPRTGSKVLDVGCGTGVWLDRLARSFDVTGVGVDISRSSISKAVGSSVHGNRYLCADAGYLPLPAVTFGIVFSLDALEHVDDQKAFLSEMGRVLEPGGQIMLWSINRSQRFTWNWLLMKLGIDIFERVAHEPELIPDPIQVVDRLRQAGLSVESLDYFNAFFTLALDEAIMLGVDLVRRLGLFEKRSAIWNLLGESFLWVSHMATAILWPLLHWLDGPWRARGLSNGFLVLASKAPILAGELASRPAASAPAGAYVSLALSTSSQRLTPGGS